MRSGKSGRPPSPPREVALSCEDCKRVLGNNGHRSSGYRNAHLFTARGPVTRPRSSTRTATPRLLAATLRRAGWPSPPLLNAPRGAAGVSTQHTALRDSSKRLVLWIDRALICSSEAVIAAVTLRVLETVRHSAGRDGCQMER